MAIRKQKLRHRIAQVGTVNAQAMGDYHPAGGPGTVMEMPVAQVLITPADQSGYSAVAYREIQPIWGPMGEAIPAVSPGQWGQLRAAGRP